MRSAPPLQSTDPLPDRHHTHALRLAPSIAAERYPLATAGAACWQREGHAFVADLALPEIPPGSIVVPSFSALGLGDYGFRFALYAGTHIWPLSPVPGTAGVQPVNGTADPRVSTHIDCWHTHATVHDAFVRLTLDARREPDDYLLTVTARPRLLPGLAGRAHAAAIDVPRRSQMTAAPAIRRRICSPTCVAMVLEHYGVSSAIHDIAESCHDGDANIYGSWPLAIHTASRHGVLGALEAFTSLDDAAPLLWQGIPIIASIDFDTGELLGAPLERSAGHLVVVTGLDEYRVFVNDPAADDDAGVARSYDRRQFATAWLDRRGVGYVLVSS
jgi:hypothetical protein